MEYIGIDVHKTQSQICIRHEDGRLTERRIRTERGRFAAVLEGRPRARVLIEASTESEWVAQCLEELGHEVIVGDPNYAPMYAHRSRRVKTDRRDARALAEACRVGAYRRAHRSSVAARQLRRRLAVRDVFVGTRVRAINVIRAVLRREGLRVRSGSSESFRRRLAEVAVSRPVAADIKPLVKLLGEIEKQLAAADERLTAYAQRDRVARRLCGVVGVGPVTAAAYVSVIDDPHRFSDAREVASYVGLVPGERSSGEQQHRGRITKAGNSRVRSLLVEAGWTVLRGRSPAMAPLRAWGERIAMRRGKRIAAVAVARRLARILYALWRDGVEYEPTVLTHGVQSSAA